MKTMRNVIQRLARARGRDGGFSLIEMIVAITILGVGLLALAGLFPLAMKRVSVGDLESRASFHAQAKLEELRRVPWSHLVATAGADTVGTRFRRDWQVQENVPVSGMKQIRVVVSWGDENGPRSTTVCTQVSDSGM